MCQKKALKSYICSKSVCLYNTNDLQDFQLHAILRPSFNTNSVNAELSIIKESKAFLFLTFSQVVINREQSGERGSGRNDAYVTLTDDDGFFEHSHSWTEKTEHLAGRSSRDSGFAPGACLLSPRQDKILPSCSR